MGLPLGRRRAPGGLSPAAIRRTLPLSARKPIVTTRVPTPADVAAAARQRLDERARQLEQLISGAQSEVNSSHEVTDRKDEAHDELQAAIAGAEMRRHLVELRDIQLARERIADGTYGECVNCGLPIAPGRLLAQPTATRCTMCQSALERHSQF